MDLSQLFRSYELLVDRADTFFCRMGKEHPTCITCTRRCFDCCHAVFGLFLIEAAYIQHFFNLLETAERQAAMLRCNDAEHALKRLEARLREHEDDPQMQAYTLARERVRCPLLHERGDCILYPHRPITCRVYGVPTRIQGNARVCGKAAFKKGESYPLYDLDGAFRDLYNLSEHLLSNSEEGDTEKASLLISVSKALTTPLDNLIHEIFGKS